MREAADVDTKEAVEQKQQPTVSQILSKVYMKLVNDRRMYRAITTHVNNFNAETERDDGWRMVIL